jgi:phage gp29-like protein
MNSKTEIDAWCNKAKTLDGRLKAAITEFDYLANSYPDMRDKTANLKKNNYNAAKERIDTVYSKLTDTKTRFCAMKAGRRSRKTRRNRK